MKDKITAHLKEEHSLILRELEEIENSLEGSPKESLEKFLKLIQKMERHFLDEKNIVFPELDKLPRKEPLKLANLEHDDWVRIHKIAKTTISSAVTSGDDKFVKPAVLTAKETIHFIRKHFRLEEELGFPLIDQITEEQANRIIEKGLFREQ